jgi:soluble lytic murein transglycosylase-like protein
LTRDPNPERSPARPRLGRALAMAAAAFFCVAGGVALGLYSTGIGATFGPRRGVPDTLATGIPRPKTPARLETRYLERALAPPAPGPEDVMRELADRYQVTHAMARMIHDASVREGVDPELTFRLIRVESVFDADAEGTGALGLMQLMPGTARDIDPRIDTRKELLDPRTNLRLGLTNLRAMIERYDGDVRLGVIAYNRGEIAVDRALRRGKDPENGYGKLVLGPTPHGGKPYTGPGLLKKKEEPADSASAAPSARAPVP